MAIEASLAKIRRLIDPVWANTSFRDKQAQTLSHPSLLFVPVILLSLLSPVSFLHAANVVTSLEPEVRQLALSGEIVPGDAAKFRKAIYDARRRGRNITSIRLNSVGGNLYESVIILRMVKFAKLTTVVGRSETCASSCFLILAAGKLKVIFPKARVGVHAPSDDKDSRSKKSVNGAHAALRIARLLGVPQSIRLKILKTPPTTMAWLGRSDLQTMAVTFQ